MHTLVDGGGLEEKKRRCFLNICGWTNRETASLLMWIRAAQLQSCLSLKYTFVGHLPGHLERPSVLQVGAESAVQKLGQIHCRFGPVKSPRHLSRYLLNHESSKLSQHNPIPLWVFLKSQFTASFVNEYRQTVSSFLSVDRMNGSILFFGYVFSALSH